MHIFANIYNFFIFNYTINTFIMHHHHQHNAGDDHSCIGLHIEYYDDWSLATSIQNSRIPVTITQSQCSVTAMFNNVK